MQAGGAVQSEHVVVSFNKIEIYLCDCTPYNFCVVNNLLLLRVPDYLQFINSIIGIITLL
jgi:hypothetical protein